MKGNCIKIVVVIIGMSLRLAFGRHNSIEFGHRSDASMSLEKNGCHGLLKAIA